MRFVIPFFALSAALIAAFWFWLGAPAAMPAGLANSAKLFCVSYAPFRRGQSPLDPSTRIERFQIEEDLARLARMTDCVRTYSVAFGLDYVPEVAERLGLQVMQGIWLSGEPDKTRAEIEGGVALANKYPHIIRALVVGNEVLLRGEMTANGLEATVRAVKARVPVPVTYADVWEFWLRSRNLVDAVDFVTIHILPYWEDFPIPASTAAAHVGSIRRHAAEAFGGKEVMIGEVGWPSAGRMREGALPSPINQARFVQEVLALSRRDNFKANVIEAFDQPWKRALEGTVGGHWGLFDADSREPKFELGAPVSNFPYWKWQAAAGIAFAAVVFAASWMTRRRDGLMPWLSVAVIATAGGATLGLTVANIPLESLGAGGWLRSLAFGAVAVLSPVLVAMSVTAGRRLPAFWEVIGRLRPQRIDPLHHASGLLFIATTVLAMIAALSLTFDPRYTDFPFAPLAAAVTPFFLLGFAGPRRTGVRPAAELCAAGLLALCAGYILFNESVANWQSLLVCAELFCLALTLTRVRGAPS